MVLPLLVLLAVALVPPGVLLGAVGAVRFLLGRQDRGAGWLFAGFAACLPAAAYCVVACLHSLNLAW